VAAAEATMNVMVEELSPIADVERRQINLTAESIEMLLFDFMQEPIYYKNARQQLLGIAEIPVGQRNASCRLQGRSLR
jgi:SHS2 domain-containing protein